MMDLLHGDSMSEISDDELQQIAELIASLPSNALRDRCRTEEQFNEWQNYKKNHLLLAEGWISEFILCQGDPIGDALEKGEISKPRHDLLKQRVTLYKYQWALVKEANKYVAECALLSTCRDAINRVSYRVSVNSSSRRLNLSYYSISELSVKLKFVNFLAFLHGGGS
jgi:hypothetical protein